MNNPTCTIPDCDKQTNARDMCSMHYMRWRQHGDPFTVLKIRGNPEKRFWMSVDKTPGQGPNGDCWIWTGGRNSGGYGQLKINNKQIKAHRYAYFLATGEWPEPLGRHTCDNPPCVNAAHVIPGTHAENTADRIKRNRSVYLRGVNHGQAKLTDEAVIEIRRLVKAGIPQGVVGRQFGVNRRCINAVHLRETWRHVQ